MQAWLLHAQIELCYITKADFGTKALFVHRQALLDCEKGTNLGLAGLTCAPNLLKWGVYRGGKGGGGQWVGAAGLCHLHTVMPCVMLRLCHIEHAEQAVQFLIMTVAKRHHR